MGLGRHGDLNIHKNPSTAAGTHVQGFGGIGGGQTNGYLGAGLRSGGGIGKFPNESFDLDIMMPPDIASIDSDISKSLLILQFVDKLSAMTPAPINTGYSYGGGAGGNWNNHFGGSSSGYGGAGGDFSGSKSNYPNYGGTNNYGNFEKDLLYD